MSDNAQLPLAKAGRNAGEECTAVVVRQELPAVVCPDPRSEPLEERLAKAQAHEEKLKHIMESVPVKIYNVSGSAAGAGSGEFHIYRKARDAERRRIAALEKEDNEKAAKLALQSEHAAKQGALDLKTNKKRAKRQKRKEKELAAKQQKRQCVQSDDTPTPNASQRQTDVSISEAHKSAAEPSKDQGQGLTEHADID